MHSKIKIVYITSLDMCIVCFTLISTLQLKENLEFKQRQHIFYILWTKILRTKVEFCRNGSTHVKSNKLPRGSENSLRMEDMNVYKYLSDNNNGSGLYSILNSSFIILN